MQYILSDWVNTKYYMQCHAIASVLTCLIGDNNGEQEIAWHVFLHFVSPWQEYGASIT